MGKKKTPEEIRAELERLESITEEEYDLQWEKAEARRAMTTKERNLEIAEKYGPRSGRNRARELGVPANAIPKCSGTNQYGEPCRLQAGYGTDHYGQGNCKYHHGNKQVAIDANPRRNRNRYSGLLSQELDAALQHFSDDADPLNIEDDIALLRSIIEHWLEQYPQWYEMMRDWHEDYKAGSAIKPKPDKIMEITEAHKMLESLSRMAKNEATRRQNTQVSQIQLFKIINSIGNVITKYVTDSETLKAIRQDMLKLRIPMSTYESYHRYNKG